MQLVQLQLQPALVYLHRLFTGWVLSCLPVCHRRDSVWSVATRPPAATTESWPAGAAKCFLKERLKVRGENIPSSYGNCVGRSALVSCLSHHFTKAFLLVFCRVTSIGINHDWVPCCCFTVKELLSCMFALAVIQKPRISMPWWALRSVEFNTFDPSKEKLNPKNVLTRTNWRRPQEEERPPVSGGPTSNRRRMYGPLTRQNVALPPLTENIRFNSLEARRPR